MIRAGRFLFLLSCFTVQVQVRASDAVRARDHIETVRFGESEVRFAPGSLVETRKDGVVHLASGDALVRLKGSGRLQTPYAYIRCQTDECQALVSRKPDRVTFRALEGTLYVHRLGDSQDYVLPPATQVKVRPVTDDGKAEMEFPQSLPWDETVKDWARLYPGGVKEFKSTLAEFREVWRESVEAVSELHQQQAGRTIASHEKFLAEQQARHASEERESEEMRRLYRQKNYLNP